MIVYLQYIVLFSDILYVVYSILMIFTTLLLLQQSGELVREFSVLPINPLTSQPVRLIPDERTGQYAPVIKTACLDKVMWVLFCLV